MLRKGCRLLCSLASSVEVLASLFGKPEKWAGGLSPKISVRCRAAAAFLLSGFRATKEGAVATSGGYS
jgi:hypothetical protein